MTPFPGPLHRPAVLLAAALALLLPLFLVARPAAAQAAESAACAPEVRHALEQTAAEGARRSFVTIRDPANGIRDPRSILDVSCIERLFDYRAFNVLFDPGRALEEILGIVTRRVCDAARDAYGDAIGRPLDATIFADTIPRLPGLDIDATGGNILDEAGRPQQSPYSDLLGVRQ